MARSLSSLKIEVRLFSTLQNTLDDAKVVGVNHPNLNSKPTLTTGLNANQANRGWQSINRVLSNGASEDIDIYDMAGIDIGAGSGDDGTGQALLIEEIVAIAIQNENAVGDNGELEIEPSSENGWTPIGIHTNATKGALRGQGLLFKQQLSTTAFEVDDGSSNRIKLTAHGGAVTYSIYIMGRSDSDESSSSSISTSSISTSSISTSISTSSSSQSESSWSSSSSVSTSSSSSSISTSSSSSISTSSASSTSTSSQSSSSSSSSSVSTSSSSSSSS